MTAIIGGTLAGFQTQLGSRGVANISTRQLSVKALGTTDEGLAEENLEESLPGQTGELIHSVQNDIGDGCTFYTRVTIDKKWKNAEGEWLDASNIHLYAGEGETELLSGVSVNDWIVWYADDEQVVMYYTLPVKAGEESSHFVDSFHVSADTSNAYADALASISFRIDAIQETAAMSAIPSEWGVYPTIENGVITSIEE